MPVRQDWRIDRSFRGGVLFRDLDGVCSGSVSFVVFARCRYVFLCQPVTTEVASF